MVSLDILPVEILHIIFFFLDSRSLCTLSCTSKELRTSIQAPKRILRDDTLRKQFDDHMQPAYDTRLKSDYIFSSHLNYYHLFDVRVNQVYRDAVLFFFLPAALSTHKDLRFFVGNYAVKGRVGGHNPLNFYEIIEFMRVHKYLRHELLFIVRSMSDFLFDRFFLQCGNSSQHHYKCAFNESVGWSEKERERFFGMNAPIRFAWPKCVCEDCLYLEKTYKWSVPRFGN